MRLSIFLLLALTFIVVVCLSAEGDAARAQNQRRLARNRKHSVAKSR